MKSHQHSLLVGTNKGKEMTLIEKLATLPLDKQLEKVKELLKKNESLEQSIKKDVAEATYKGMILAIEDQINE